jgi:zinc transporter 2
MFGMSKEKRLSIAIGLSLIFFTVEVIGGIWSNSLAILTDASHLLTDIAGFAIALLATIVAKREADDKYTYGLVRAEVMGALFSVITLWIITAILLYEAYFRAVAWFEGHPPVVRGKLMSIIALFGVCVNICLATVFHEDHGGAFHSHDHGGNFIAQILRTSSNSLHEILYASSRAWWCTRPRSLPRPRWSEKA